MQWLDKRASTLIKESELNEKIMQGMNTYFGSTGQDNWLNHENQVELTIYNNLLFDLHSETKDAFNLS